MRVALFEPDWRSPISLLIALVTRTPWTHAAFEIDGTWYDASEARGDFNEVNIHASMRGRLAHVYHMGNRIVVRDMLEAHIGTPYDYKGVLGYLWKRGDDRRFYCFEAVYAAMTLADGSAGEQPPRVNGWDIAKHLGAPRTIERF